MQHLKAKTFNMFLFVAYVTWFAIFNRFLSGLLGILTVLIMRFNVEVYYTKYFNGVKMCIGYFQLIGSAIVALLSVNYGVISNVAQRDVSN